MTPLPEDEVGWDGPDPEPAEPDEDLGAGLKGRAGGANVLTGILTLDAALDNHVMSNAARNMKCSSFLFLHRNGAPHYRFNSLTSWPYITSDFSGALKTLLYVV